MFIILHNPLSKSKKSKRTTKHVVDEFKRRNIPFRLKSLLKIRDIEDYIKKTPKDIKILLLGGDGTINTFINNTYNLAIENDIYLKATGSGNDFLRSLKKQRPASQFIGQMRYNQKNRFFMNGAGMGIDGEISHRVNQAIRKSRFNYFINTIKALLTFKPKYCEVFVDGELHTFKKTYLVNVNRGEFIGGGMRLTPEAKLDKAELDVIIVHRIPKVFILFIFLSVYFGLHTKFRRYVFHRKAKHVKASMFSRQISQCDGESFKGTREIEVSLTDKRAKFQVFDIEKNT